MREPAADHVLAELFGLFLFVESQERKRILKSSLVVRLVQLYSYSADQLVHSGIEPVCVRYEYFEQLRPVRPLFFTYALLQIV